jgi:secreted trypsin-like serine protease
MRHEALLSLAWLLSQSPLVASRSRIVGGDPADVLRYPYYTSLYRDAISDSYFACGGTLVAPDVILTAAHCIDESIRFAVVNNTSLSGDNPNARPRRVLTSFVHPQWDPESVRNDIALLFLDVVVDINPIIYNRKYLAETSESMSIVGLGKLQEQGNFPSTLQDATVLMSDFDICNTAYSTNSQLTFLHGLDNDTQICASSSGIDSCGGDSGGPLLSSTAQQVGIVSFGHGCAREGYPGK